MDKFSRNQSASCPWKTEISEKFWMSFPEFANRG